MSAERELLDRYSVTMSELVSALRRKDGDLRNFEFRELAARCDHLATRYDALPKGGEAVPVIDLDQCAWEAIKQAAKDSPWIPKEYWANDWHADVISFLTEPGSPQTREPTIEDVAALPAISFFWNDDMLAALKAAGMRKVVL